MDNISQSENIMAIFDLKGSIYKRTSADGKIYKDNDFVM